MAEDTITVIVADDHKLLREALCSLLESQSGIEVVGEAANGRQAVELARRAKPDVVVMDIVMPDVNGAIGTVRILEVAPDTRVLALSAYSDRKYVARMLEAGASGYLTKDCAAEELVEAIEVVCAGNTYLSPPVAHTVVKDYLLQPQEPGVPTETLTEREREILQLLAEGWTTRMISRSLHISHKTVATHRRNIMEKLDCRSITELVKYAVRHGVTDVNF